MSHGAPRRILSSGESSPLERSLLLAGRARREPEGARDRVWSAIALAGAGTGGAFAAGSLAAGSAGSRAAGVKGVGLGAAITKTKLLVIGAVVAASAGAMGTLVATKTTREAPSASTSTPRVAPAAPGASVHPGALERPSESPPSLTLTTDPATINLAPAKAPTPLWQPRDLPVAPVLTRAPSATKPARADAPPIATSASRIDTAETEAAPAPSTQAPSTLGEEATLLATARADLARGDAAAAAQRLAESQRRFPNAVLNEERDVLAVRTAEAQGDHVRARSLARTFLARHPRSPLRKGVEGIASE